MPILEIAVQLLFDGHGVEWGHGQRVENLTDPAVVEGSQEKRMAVFRNVRDEIRSYLEGFLREHRFEYRKGLKPREALSEKVILSQIQYRYVLG